MGGENYLEHPSRSAVPRYEEYRKLERTPAAVAHVRGDWHESFESIA
jgi:hypothetical protein